MVSCCRELFLDSLETGRDDDGSCAINPRLQRRFLSGKYRGNRRKRNDCVIEAVDCSDERVFSGQRPRMFYELDGSMMHSFVLGLNDQVTSGAGSGERRVR